MYKDKYLNQIVDAVKQGIVASKESDSKFWGDFNQWRKAKDERDEKMHDTMIKLGITMESLLEAKKIQNGRIGTCETKIESVSGVIRYWKGAIALGTILIGAVAGLSVYIFNKTDNKLTEVSHELSEHIKVDK